MTIHHHPTMASPKKLPATLINSIDFIPSSIIIYNHPSSPMKINEHMGKCTSIVPTSPAKAPGILQISISAPWNFEKSQLGHLRRAMKVTKLHETAHVRYVIFAMSISPWVAFLMFFPCRYRPKRPRTCRFLIRIFCVSCGWGPLQRD